MCSSDVLKAAINPVALASGAVTGAAVEGLFKPPEAPDVPAPPPTPSGRTTDQAVSRERARERRRAQTASGRQSTILTGPQGAQQGGSTAPVKTLLGS